MLLREDGEEFLNLNILFDSENAMFREQCNNNNKRRANLKNEKGAHS